MSRQPLDLFLIFLSQVRHVVNRTRRENILIGHDCDLIRDRGFVEIELAYVRCVVGVLELDAQPVDKFLELLVVGIEIGYGHKQDGVGAGGILFGGIDGVRHIAHYLLVIKADEHIGILDKHGGEPSGRLIALAIHLIKLLKHIQPQHRLLLHQLAMIGTYQPVEHLMGDGLKPRGIAQAPGESLKEAPASLADGRGISVP